MNRDASAILIALLLADLTACTSEAVKRGSYEALRQKQCADNARGLACDPAHQPYEQYDKDREAMLKSNSE